MPPLPITSEQSAASIPGLAAAELPPLPDKNMERKPPFRTPIFARLQDERGITAQAVSSDGEVASPTVPIPVRSSLAQTVLIFRRQITTYISRVKPYGMAPGYPTAKVPTILHTTPRHALIRSARGYPASKGQMLPPKRFTKALPTKQNDYEAPTY